MNLLHTLIQLYILVIVASALLSWFPPSTSAGGLATAQRVLRTITEPVLRPLRQIVPRPNLGGVSVDFSPIVAILLLGIINNFI